MELDRVEFKINLVITPSFPKSFSCPTKSSKLFPLPYLFQKNQYKCNYSAIMNVEQLPYMRGVLNKDTMKYEILPHLSVENVVMPQKVTYWKSFNVFFTS